MKTTEIANAFNRAKELLIIESIKGQGAKDTDLKRFDELIESK